MRYVSVIFTPEPSQWGLRGDPFLWQLLMERLEQTNCSKEYFP